MKNNLKYFLKNYSEVYFFASAIGAAFWEFQLLLLSADQLAGDRTALVRTD